MRENPKLAVVSNDLAGPPYPSDLLAKGWRFELDLDVIDQSDTWTLSPPELRPWLLMLWASSWTQHPIGSYSDNDEVIASRIGMPLAMFKSFRHILMRGWERCSDGRVYHSMITKLVLKMLTHRRIERQRVADWRAANQALDPNVTRYKHVRTCEYDTGTGTGTGTGTPVPTPSASEPPKPKPLADGVQKTDPSARKKRSQEPKKTSATALAYGAAYESRYGVQPLFNQVVNANLSRFIDRVGAEEAPAIAAFYVRSNRRWFVEQQHSAKTLLAHAEQLRTEWVTGHQGTESEARMGDRTAATGNVFNQLMDEAKRG